MIRLAASRRLVGQSSRFTTRQQLPTFKRFNSHHAHEPEHPPEYLFKKTSVFAIAFCSATAALLINDRLNSNGKSLIGNWLISAPNTEAITNNLDENTEAVVADRNEKVKERSLSASRLNTRPDGINYVPETNPRA